jgi:alpha-beta hydrolase superfamily lysophospholipase
MAAITTPSATGTAPAASSQRPGQPAGGGPVTGRRFEGFPVGYYDLHPDVSVNYNMNRFSTGEADMIGEMRAVGPRIHDYKDYTREFLALGEAALGCGEKLNGAYYLRSAEFYMFADDTRKQPTRRQFLQLIREHYGFTGTGHFDIPYDSGALSAYRPTPPAQPKGTIVWFGGFDTYIEELFPMQKYFAQAGYDVVIFDGPGQGTTLEDHHLPLTHEWHKPVGAVLDYFGLDDVTLIGESLGGCLVVRAAAYEPRVSRVVANEICTDVADITFAQMKPAQRDELSALLKIGADHTINTVFKRAMKQSLVTEWGVKQGMLVTGTHTPAEWLHQNRLYRTDDVSPLIEQDVLLLAGAEDHFIPRHQFYDQIQMLTRARSLTARMFTRHEQAHEHCQIGNLGLQYKVIKDWLEILRERGPANGQG